MPQKHIHTPDEPGELVTVSIESEKPSSGEIPRVCLASVCWHMDNVNGPRNGADASKGRTDESRAQADVSNTPNKAETLIVSYGDEPDTYLSVRDANRTVDETDGPESHTDALSGHGDAPTTSNGAGTTWISHGEGASTYLGARDAKRDVDETDGLGGHADTSNGQADSLYAANETATPANAPEHVRMRQNHLRTPDLPAGSATSRSDATDGFRNCADRSNACTHVQSIVHETETAANPSKTVSIRQIEPKPPDIPDSTANRTLDESDSLTSHADRLDVDADVQNGANKMETPADEAETISMCQIEPKPPQPLTMGANGHANEMDRSRHHPGTLNMCMHAVTPADEVGNISTCPNKQKWLNLPISTTKQLPDETISRGNSTETSNACMDMHSIGNDAKTAKHAIKIVRASPNEPKMQNSPSEAARQCSDEPNACGNLTDGSSAHMGSHSIETNARTPANKAEHIRMRQINPKL